MKCNLCQKERQLMNSHIIPEFFYKPAYDKNHKLNIYKLNDGQKLRFEQKGIREKLLCEMCEGQLSQYEDYVRRIFYGKGNGVSIKNSNPIILEGLNYDLFKLFQLSVIWRASISKRKFFQNVDLGPHQNKIRKMIIENNPGDELEYPCIITMLLIDRKELIDGFIMSPDRMRILTQWAYRFIFGGGFWVYFVSNQTYRLPIQKYILSKSGRLVIPFRYAEDTDFFKKLSINIASNTILH